MSGRILTPLSVRRRDLASNERRYDPTRTGAVRRSYTADVTRRLKRVATLVRQTVVEDDAFGLRPSAPLAFESAGRNRFVFGTVDERRDAFLAWLQEQIDREVLEVVGGAGNPLTGLSNWQNAYIRATYLKAVTQVDGDLLPASPTLPGIRVPGNPNDIFTIPYHTSALQRLYTRAFDRLRGITAEMSVQIGERLALGLAQGLPNQDIAKSLVDRVEKIGITRARMLVRTEVIAAHADATLNRLENDYGVGAVVAEVEFATARDAVVCPRCAALDARIYTIAEARGVIPVHPNCRCAWKPAIRLATVGNHNKFLTVRNGRATLIRVGTFGNKCHHH